MISHLMRTLTTLSLLLLLTATGCESSNESEEETEHGHHHEHGHDHEHSDRPESLQAAISELKEMSEKIAAAMENDDPDAAHDPLHDVGNLLEILPELAADTDLPESDWKETKKASESLFEAFGVVDASFHKKDADRKAAYAEAKSQIDEGIAALEAKLELLDDDHKHHGHHHGHDHDHEDDHDHEEHDEDDHDHEDHEHEDHEEHQE